MPEPSRFGHVLYHIDQHSVSAVLDPQSVADELRVTYVAESESADVLVTESTKGRIRNINWSK
jgi:hypothetical protein